MRSAVARRCRQLGDPRRLHRCRQLRPQVGDLGLGLAKLRIHRSAQGIGVVVLRLDHDPSSYTIPGTRTRPLI